MTGKELLRLITSRKIGGTKVRSKGSHHRVQVGNCTATIPVHGHDIPIGTLRQIEKDLEPCLGEGWLRKATGR